MAQQLAPTPQQQFLGVYCAGNPAQRPKDTAARCQDFRIMPGGWLRLRGGRTARYNTAGGTVQQIHQFRQPAYWGSLSHLAQVKYGPTDIRWCWLNLSNYVLAEPGIEGVSTVNDGAFAASNPVAVCNLLDRPLYYNGQGVMDGVSSRPPFSTYIGGITRFYGLDAYIPAGTSPLPTVSFTPGAGFNAVLDYVKLYVGLYDATTNHYSNGIYMGQINATSSYGTITASNLQALKVAYHAWVMDGIGIQYVFYATIDNGQVPYLILNSTLDGPFAVSNSSNTANLSIAGMSDSGWVLDYTHEMPIQNYPPRPMRSVAYLNGRLYGALLAGGGSTSRPDFSYQPNLRELASVVWSRSAADSLTSNFLGDPLQSWPLQNAQATPSGEQPLVVEAALDGVRLLVITASSAFYLTEQSDGLQEFTTISRSSGISVPATLKATPYGHVWMDQRNQMVLLSPGATTLRVLSGDFHPLITAQPVCADYLKNGPVLIDRYEVFLADGNSVCYDFELTGPSGQSFISSGSYYTAAPSGQAYSSTGQPYTAACTVVDANGKIHHIAANSGIYVRESQPETGLTPSTDQTFTTGQSHVSSEVNGDYIRNWDDWGDSNLRKELPWVDLIGDGAMSTALGESPITFGWYGDLQQVIDANEQEAPITKAPQSSTDSAWRFALAGANRFFYKLRFRLAGHSTDDASFANHYPPDQQGDLALNFYGSIVRLLAHIGKSQNRS
jgi:hypothetical protein